MNASDPPATATKPKPFSALNQLTIASTDSDVCGALGLGLLGRLSDNFIAGVRNHRTRGAWAHGSLCSGPFDIHSNSQRQSNVSSSPRTQSRGRPRKSHTAGHPQKRGGRALDSIRSLRSLRWDIEKAMVNHDRPAFPPGGNCWRTPVCLRRKDRRSREDQCSAAMAPPSTRLRLAAAHDTQTPGRRALADADCYYRSAVTGREEQDRLGSMAVSIKGP
jgi:hypothetical protein